MRSNKSCLIEEAFWEVNCTKSCFVLGYCIPDKTISKSAAEGALGGCEVAICLSNRDFCSNPSPQILQVNWERAGDDCDAGILLRPTCLVLLLLPNFCKRFLYICHTVISLS